MRKLIYGAVTCLTAAFLLGGSQFIMPIFEPPVATGAPEFVPLHHYFISTTGNDSNNGLTSGTAWATPNHSVVCGDVIEVIPGTYDVNFGWGSGTVSNCPSTTGGIAGTGGIDFAILLCGGADLEACQIHSSQTGQDLVALSTNFWAVEGLKCNGSSGSNRCFMSSAPNSTTVIHHNAFINNIAYDTAQGFGLDDCPGGMCNHNVPGDGTDYWAVVGNIAQNAAQSGVQLAAIDAVGPAQIDSAAGTHIYFYGNASYANRNPGSTMDTESFMFDTWDAHAVTYQGVIANNIGYSSDRMCIQLFWQNSVNTPVTTPNPYPTMKLYNNTCFRNNLNTGTDNMDGEININNNGGSPALPWVVTIQNNIIDQPLSVSSGTPGSVAAFALYGSTVNFTHGGTGNENVYKANNSSCKFAFCDAGFNAESNGNGTTDLGTNTYTDPLFANTTDLLANQVGVPSCAGKQTVTQCLGYDPNTRVLTSPSIIADLQASCVGCTGKGYQLPSTTCAPNADYPTWLKGIVVLRKNQVDGKFYEYPDLVTKPCSL